MIDILVYSVLQYKYHTRRKQMLNIHTIAKIVSQTTSTEADRYDQIWAIKKELKANGFELFSTDRETIDDILDILFEEYGFDG